jgi:hypothetical protein
MNDISNVNYISTKYDFRTGQLRLKGCSINMVQKFNIIDDEKMIGFLHKLKT